MWDSNGSPSHAPFRRHSLVWWAIVIDARPKQIIRYFLMLLEYVGSFDQLIENYATCKRASKVNNVTDKIHEH